MTTLDLAALLRRILSEPESNVLLEPAETGRMRGRIETGWFDLTPREAALLEQAFFGDPDT